MGQQQLLLVVLGLIVVSIAIGVANQLFDAHAEDSNKDNIANELVNLASLAQQYFNKPTGMGGGNQSFTNWYIPSDLDSTASGFYQVTSLNSNTLQISGTPFPQSGYSWHLQTTVSKTEIVTELID